MAVQSALVHSSLSRVAQAETNSRKRTLEAVRKAGAREVIGLLLGDRARRGVSLEPAAGWNLRVGVQVPLTSARELDYNVIFLATRGF